MRGLQSTQSVAARSNSLERFAFESSGSAVGEDEPGKKAAADDAVASSIQADAAWRSRRQADRYRETQIALTSPGARALLGCALVGVAAGLITAFADTLHLHLGLPGHKILLWMPPVIVARLMLRHRIGATAAAGTTAVACLGCGANLAGGPTWMPLILLAGTVLDVAAALAEKLDLRNWRLVPWFALAGALAAMLCAAKRIIIPKPRWFALAGIPDPAASVLVYVFFGLVAGVIGAAVAIGALQLGRKAA